MHDKAIGLEGVILSNGALKTLFNYLQAINNVSQVHISSIAEEFEDFKVENLFKEERYILKLFELRSISIESQKEKDFMVKVLMQANKAKEETNKKGKYEWLQKLENRAVGNREAEAKVAYIEFLYYAAPTLYLGALLPGPQQVVNSGTYGYSKLRELQTSFVEILEETDSPELHKLECVLAKLIATNVIIESSLTDENKTALLKFLDIDAVTRGDASKLKDMGIPTSLIYYDSVPGVRYFFAVLCNSMDSKINVWKEEVKERGGSELESTSSTSVSGPFSYINMNRGKILLSFVAVGAISCAYVYRPDITNLVDTVKSILSKNISGPQI